MSSKTQIKTNKNEEINVPTKRKRSFSDSGDEENPRKKMKTDHYTGGDILGRTVVKVRSLVGLVPFLACSVVNVDEIMKCRDVTHILDHLKVFYY